MSQAFQSTPRHVREESRPLHGTIGVPTAAATSSGVCPALFLTSTLWPAHQSVTTTAGGMPKPVLRTTGEELSAACNLA